MSVRNAGMFATLKLQRTTKVMEVRVKPINTINGNLDVASYESKKRVVSSHEETYLYEQTKPILTNLQLFGMYIPTRTVSEVYRENDGLPYSNVRIDTLKSKNRRAPLPLIVYGFAVNVMLWLNVVRLLFLFQGNNSFGPVLFGKVTFVAWSLFCAITCSCLLRISLNINCLHRFYLQLQHVCKTFGTADRAGLTRRSTLIFTCVGWSMMIMNMTYCAFGLHATQLWENVMYPFEMTSPYYSGMTAVYLFIHLYLSAAWALSAILTFIICKIIYHQVEAFNDAVKEVTSGAKSLAENIQRLRSWHQQLCYIVDTADNMLCAELGAGFVLYIMISCVVLYNLFWDEKVTESIISLITGITWLILCVAHMALFAIGGGVVNAVAHASYTDLHDLNLEGVSSETALQVTMLLNRLSGSSIGLTALKMFVIDKPTILTLLGMLLTYFVLILQFAPGFTSSSAASSSCNCSEVLMNSTLQCFVIDD